MVGVLSFTKPAVNISDLRRRAKRRLPRMVFDYIDGGAGDERTMRANESAYAELLFRPRSGVVVPSVATVTSVLDQDIAFPFMLAPVGSSRMFWPRGEAAASAAAGKAGTGYILSTLSGTRLEEVSAATTGPVWYQLYLAGGHDVTLATLERAAASGYTALVVTVDTPVAGNRERDVRNGAAELISLNPRQMLPYVWQVAARPNWILDFYRDGGMMSFPNVVLPDGPMPYDNIGAPLITAPLRWLSPTMAADS